MTGSGTYFHISFLVPDLAAAIEFYSKLFNIEFREPTTSSIRSFEQYGVEESASEVRYAYSIAGPPYYELIEATGSGQYSPSLGLGFHHIGMWMDDPDLTRAELAKRNIAIEGIYWAPGGDPFTIHTAPAGPGGVRIEYLNRRYQGYFQNFFDTGKYS